MTETAQEELHHPTPRLRLLRKFVYLSEQTGRFEDRIQQLWESDFQGEEAEWRDVEIVKEPA